MANLQVRDIDDQLYESIRVMASSEKRSISQEVVHILEQYLSSPGLSRQNRTDEFLSLSGSWDDQRGSEEIVKEIRNGRHHSSRFDKANELFD